MNFFGEPFDLMGTVGPPTAYQPEWSGVGFKHYVFKSSPVTHVIAPDNAHHQYIDIDPEDDHLPVEREIMGLIQETGYNPRQFNLPEHLTHWDYVGEQFGYPDTRVGSNAQPVARKPRSQAAQARTFNQMPARPPQGRIRDASEASLPYKPGSF